MVPLRFLRRRIPVSDRNTSRLAVSRQIALSEARGVGNINRDDKSSLALMPRADAASRKYEWENSVSRFCQVKYRLVEPHMDEASNILPKHPMGPQFGNNAAHFRPQVALIRKAFSLPGSRERLAGESTGKDGDGFKPGLFKERLLCECGDISEFGNIRPMLLQHRVRVIRPFTLADGLETGSFRR